MLYASIWYFIIFIFTLEHMFCTSCALLSFTYPQELCDCGGNKIEWKGREQSGMGQNRTEQNSIEHINVRCTQK